MSNRIRLPDHYAPTIGSMRPDDITLASPYALAADYLTRNLHVDPVYALDDTPPTLDGKDEIYDVYELQQRIPIMRFFNSVDGYVADLSNAQKTRIDFREIEEATEEADLRNYPRGNADMYDYNAYRQSYAHYIPLAAVAIRSIEGSGEFIGSGPALDAAVHLRKTIDERLARARDYEQTHNQYNPREPDDELTQHFDTAIHDD